MAKRVRSLIGYEKHNIAQLYRKDGDLAHGSRRVQYNRRVQHIQEPQHERFGRPGTNHPNKHDHRAAHYQSIKKHNAIFGKSKQ